MTPNQRRKKLAAFKNKKKKTPFSLGKVISLLLIFFVVFGYIYFTSKVYALSSRTTVVVNKNDGVLITTFDKEEGSITNLVLPPETQVNVSRQLGTWKASSIFKLGENEKLSGTLLAETIMKNFKIPVYGWADAGFAAISEGGFFSSLRGVLGYKTNLGVGDRLRLAIFSSGVNPTKRLTIDLSGTGFLRKTKLVGGEDGYLILGNLPQSLSSIFTDRKINNLAPTILVENFQTRTGAVDVVAGTLEVLGGKVTSIVPKEKKDFYCEVAGADKYTVQIVSHIFSCAKTKETKKSNFDLTVRIGEEFGKRF